MPPIVADQPISDLTEGAYLDRVLWAFLVHSPYWQQVIGGDQLLTPVFTDLEQQALVRVRDKRTFDLNTLYLILRLSGVVDNGQKIQEAVQQAIDARK